jgi:hypothetical protein
MVKMTPEEWRAVGEAIVIWSGWGRSSWPARNGEALIEHFGGQRSARLLPVIRGLEDKFYVSSEQFASKYPELPEDAVRAFAPLRGVARLITNETLPTS